jgi:predicted GTPase
MWEQLFNALAGRRVAIGDPMAGVRDRAELVRAWATQRGLVDTGGIGLVDETLLADEIDA